MELILTFTVRPGGEIQFIYHDAFEPLLHLGEAHITRASHVEPAENGLGWTADLSPVNGPLLGPFTHRAEALAAEVTWLEQNHLGRSA